MEIEVKFFLQNRPKIRGRIIELGGESQGRVFETNIRFEDPDNGLLKRHSLLRLRRDRTSRLTFKSSPGTASTQFKIYHEIEVEVSDFEAMAHILESLGFHQEQVYQKYRESFTLNRTLVCLDTMPFGDFLEIEGSRESIRSLAQALGLPWGKRILHNYFALFAGLKKRMDLPFSDITFDNFERSVIDWKAAARFLESQEAGRKPEADVKH